MCVVGAINNYTAALKDSSSPCKHPSYVNCHSYLQPTIVVVYSYHASRLS